jgi:uncharacterized coiled-coil DUF342 family protein
MQQKEYRESDYGPTTSEAHKEREINETVKDSHRQGLLQTAEILEYQQMLAKMRRAVDYYRAKSETWAKDFTDLQLKFDRVSAKNKKRKKALKEMNHAVKALQLENFKLCVKTETRVSIDPRQMEFDFNKIKDANETHEGQEL